MSIENDFIKYHQANPQIYRAFLYFADQVQQKGYKKIGAKMLAERIRWETMINTGNKYKVQNSYTAFYARLLMVKVPSMRNLFRLKRINIDGQSDLYDIRTWNSSYWSQFK